MRNLAKIQMSPKHFRPPLQTSKNFSAPPFLPWKLWVNPIEKHVNSIFTGKFVVIFLGAPLIRVKNSKGQLFASGPPNKCLWTVPYIICWKGIYLKYKQAYSIGQEVLGIHYYIYFDHIKINFPKFVSWISNWKFEFWIFKKGGKMVTHPLHLTGGGGGVHILRHMHCKNSGVKFNTPGVVRGPHQVGVNFNTSRC